MEVKMSINLFPIAVLPQSICKIIMFSAFKFLPKFWKSRTVLTVCGDSRNTLQDKLSIAGEKAAGAILKLSQSYKIAFIVKHVLIYSPAGTLWDLIWNVLVKQQIYSIHYKCLQRCDLYSFFPPPFMLFENWSEIEGLYRYCQKSKQVIQLLWYYCDFVSSSAYYKLINYFQAIKKISNLAILGEQVFGWPRLVRLILSRLCLYTSQCQSSKQ